MEVSLIIPAYNEEKRIENTIEKAIAFLEQYFTKYEILIADDGSQDNTVRIIKNYNKENIKILSLQHKGKGNAIKQGVLNARGKYLFFMDADLPYALENILEGVRIFESNKADLVIGSRDLYKGKDAIPYPWHRKLMSNIFSAYINMILHLNIPDTQCGFKGMKNEVGKHIFQFMTLEGFGFDFEMLFIARKYSLNIERIPVQLSHSTGSKVHIIKDSFNMIKEAFGVRIKDMQKKYQ